MGWRWNDLSGVTPLVRIASLAMLGVTLYVVGWMYKKMDAIKVEPDFARP